MVERINSRGLIQKSLVELLAAKDIDDISVKEIAKNCRMTTRAIYYYFRDKYDIANSVYLDEMQKYLQSSLRDWYEQMGRFMEQYESFFSHTLTYMGQNCLADTIIDLEWEKLRLHIKPEVKSDHEQYFKVMLGIEYMLYGNLGSLRASFVNGKGLLRTEHGVSYFTSSWDYISEFLSPMVRDSLAALPVHETAGQTMKVNCPSQVL